MTDELDDMFGKLPPRPSFVARVAPGREPDFPPPAPVEYDDDKAYRAFGGATVTDITASCRIRHWRGDIPVATSIPYRLLVRKAIEADNELRLFLPDCTIVIEGRGMNDLLDRLERWSVAFIQQYHPGIWPPPADTEPLVERIEVLRPETFKQRV